ncbi:hypothetical protein [Actinoallomurus oryzae]
MDDGVLTLRIPKARQSQGHRIEIGGGHPMGEEKKAKCSI